ncbi:MAG TPA: AI-2E family transporter, partial [Acidimicrobiales bacterium]|nr:AI-2E family transporter [Acidimicrobiales bacterium]
TGALGVAVAFLIVRTIVDAGQILSLILLALFIAVGLDPAVVWLEKRGLRRWLAVLIVILVLLAVVGAFAAAAIAPISKEVQVLTNRIPTYVHDVKTGQGWVGHLAKKFHFNNQIKSFSPSKLVSSSTVGGLLGAGKAIVSALTAVSIVTVLTVYFLAALPGIRKFGLRTVPRSRRPRVTALTDEILSRVGGFVLGNLVTSVISGVLTTLWLAIFGVPYAVLLGLLVAILDLIPMVGSTIGGIIVSLVALSKGIPVAAATAAFYVAYRLIEDYLLTPRVMRHTVSISAGATIVAVLIGGTLLGLIGAVIAIPVAAAIRLILEEVTFQSLDKK